jgi:hypothetical protein
MMLVHHHSEAEGGGDSEKREIGTSFMGEIVGFSYGVKKQCLGALGYAVATPKPYPGCNVPFSLWTVERITSNTIIGLIDIHQCNQAGDPYPENEDWDQETLPGDPRAYKVARCLRKVRGNVEYSCSQNRIAVRSPTGH